MVKIVNVLKASGLYTAIIFALYVGAIFPQQGRGRDLAPGREAEMIGSKFGAGRHSLSRTPTKASLAGMTGQYTYVSGGTTSAERTSVGALAQVKSGMMLTGGMGGPSPGY